jgi:hypothetical protein
MEVISLTGYVGGMQLLLQVVAMPFSKHHEEKLVESTRSLVVVFLYY